MSGSLVEYERGAEEGETSETQKVLWTGRRGVHRNMDPDSGPHRVLPPSLSVGPLSPSSSVPGPFLTLCLDRWSVLSLAHPPGSSPCIQGVPLRSTRLRGLLPLPIPSPVSTLGVRGGRGFELGFGTTDPPSPAPALPLIGPCFPGGARDDKTSRTLGQRVSSGGGRGGVSLGPRPGPEGSSNLFPVLPTTHSL